jgi:hypothetical protein
MTMLDDHGPFLRVEEAAQMLRISRTVAYALARRWLETDRPGSAGGCLRRG